MRLVWTLVVAAGCRFDLPQVDEAPGPPDLGAAIHTELFQLAVCTSGAPGTPTCPLNRIPLDVLGNGAGIPEARILTWVQVVSGGLYLNSLELVPGSVGAYIEHPLFFSIPVDPRAKPIADPLDRFQNLTLSLAPADPPHELLTGGTAAFPSFPPESKIAITFAVARPL